MLEFGGRIGLPENLNFMLVCAFSSHELDEYLLKLHKKMHTKRVMTECHQWGKWQKTIYFIEMWKWMFIYKVHEVGKVKNFSIKKCDCMFRLRGYLLSVGVWILRVGDRERNHETTQVFQGRKYVERLRPEEKRLIRESTTLVLTRIILIAL